MSFSTLLPFSFLFSACLFLLPFSFEKINERTLFFYIYFISILKNICIYCENTHARGYF
ncbi:MAG: hypothetical protein UU76_C0019G0012 [Parcubacteria group bacterium GW2011_GWC1_41_7]|nr:MAG: hypothetical protein UU76_C0019G0012 [Parcubacteria group bacterium GW2011_GWC1_41_7]